MPPAPPPERACANAAAPGVAAIRQFSEGYTRERNDKAARRAARRAAAEGGVAASAEPAPGVRVLEALSATGLRAVRYAREIEGLGAVVANDFSAEAVEAIKRNVEFNGLDPEAQVRPNRGDANLVMHTSRADGSPPFDVVDLDPYGSAAPFLDAAVQAVADGGLLCITCTDMAVLSGNNPEACFAKYGSVSVRAKYCHEMGLRILLASVAQHAARSRRYIRPLLSLSIDFYCRVFVRVHTSAAEVKRLGSRVGTLYNCVGCDAFHTHPTVRVVEDGRSLKFKAPAGPPVGPKCAQCDSVFHMGGPIWTDPIHDADFVAGLLRQCTDEPERFGTHKRMQGMLSVVQEELPDCPLYYHLPSLCNKVHCTAPRLLAMRSAFLAAGYRVSCSHADPEGIKTDATPAQVWDIMRAWIALNPIARSKHTPAAAALLAHPTPEGVCFDVRADANPKSRASGISRFPANPEPNWGPKSRAKSKRAAGDGVGHGPGGGDQLQAKRLANQGHRKAKQAKLEGEAAAPP